MDDAREAALTYAMLERETIARAPHLERAFVAGAEWQAKRDAERASPAVTEQMVEAAEESLQAAGLVGAHDTYSVRRALEAAFALSVKGGEVS